jgi:chromosome segregation ATPase
MDLRISDEEDEFDSEEESAEDELDPISAERRRRKKAQDRLRRSAGEPVKPEVSEVLKLREPFLAMLRAVLSD